MNKDEYTAEQKYELGTEEGRKWAANHATPEQLERLAEAEDPVHGWGFGNGESAFTPGDLLAAVMNCDDPVRGEFAGYVSLRHHELADDPDFAEGFADACLEVWYEDHFEQARFRNPTPSHILTRPSLATRYTFKVFDREPPHLPDLCSVQAVTADPAGAIQTIYRKQLSTAGDWIAGTARDKRFDSYLLRRGNGCWERRDVHGEPTNGSNAPAVIPFLESTVSVSVDRAAFLQEARELTGDVGMSLIACREGHAGASAADHSNFNVVCRRMIGEADSEDLEHVVIIDTRKWPCPVTGVFANVARLSPAMKDVFLDRVKWLQNSLPMVSAEFHELLAHRLAKLRQAYVYDLLRQCGRAAQMTEDRITAMVEMWLLASPGPRYRFAEHIVATLREGLVYHPHSAETFSPEIVESRGATVVKDYKKHLTLSRA